MRGHDGRHGGGGLEGIQHRLAQEESFRTLRGLHVRVPVDLGEDSLLFVNISVRDFYF